MYAAENPKFSAEIAGKQSFFCFGKYSSELVKKQFGQTRCETWGSVALVLCCLCTNVNQGALFPMQPVFSEKMVCRTGGGEFCRHAAAMCLLNRRQSVRVPIQQAD